ncbi:MAG: class I SAM-dependent methyltransferase [Negativicutes bacterium]|nr:class I SAM-dependent methyltransferase [Negativicutes bacterium]
MNSNEGRLFCREQPCPVCGAGHFDVVLDWPRVVLGGDDGPAFSYRLAVCGNCGHFCMNPAFSSQGIEFLAGFMHRDSYCSRNHRQVIDFLVQNDFGSGGTRVVDLGCGRGDLLARLPFDGDRLGIEFDSQVWREAKGRYPQFNFICCDLAAADAGAMGDRFLLVHVLEHLIDPAGLLRNLYNQSPENSRLYVEVPLLDTALARDIIGFAVMHHLHHFSQAGIKALLAACGWRPEIWQVCRDYNGIRLICRKAEPIPPPTDCRHHNRHLVYRHLAQWWEVVAAVNQRLAVVGNERFVLWGAGIHTEYLYQLTGLFARDSCRQVVDSDPAKHGRCWRWFEVTAPESAPVDSFLVISSYSFQDEIAVAARQLGWQADRIVTLYPQTGCDFWY